jgi:hypothetical protein
MTSGLATATATSALSRETSTKETPETAETHVEKCLKRLWARIGETLKRLRSTNAGRWWLVWVSGGRKWVLGLSKAVNAACLAVFDPSTNIALSRQPEFVKKFHMQVYGPLHLNCTRVTIGYSCTTVKRSRYGTGFGSKNGNYKYAQKI